MKFLKKLFLSTLFLLTPLTFLNAQTSGNGGSSPWLVLTDEYNTSPFNDTTDVKIYFDGTSYSGYVTSVQFKIAYDGNAFDSLYTITDNLSSDYTMSYNEDKTNDEVLISIVYTGSSSTTSFPNSHIVTLKFDNIATALLYSNEQNLTAFTFAGYSAVGSNANGTDISVGTHTHGGALKVPHRKYSGYILDYGTDKGIPNLEYQLYRGNSLMTTVLGGQPTTTTSTGYYEMVYYEHYYGAIDNNTTDFDFLFKTEDLDSDAALSTADSYKQLLYANQKISLNAYQRLASDVNHSHTSTIADSYVLYGYNSGAYSGWSGLGAGGYRDVMFVKPEQIKYLEDDSTTVVTGVGTGPLGISPQETNWTYDLNSYNTITTHDVNFYVVIMGDVNLTSLGGSTYSPKIMPSINSPFSKINTSIIAQLPDQQVATGDEFLVDLTINTQEQNVHSFNFELDYDPDVLEFLEASTPYLPNAWMLYFDGDSLGRVSYGGLDGSTGSFPVRTDTMESILQFKFKAKSVTGIGETPIKFGSKYNTGDSKGDDFHTQVIDGKVYLQVVSSVLNDASIPKGFKLNQNYPNPFNPTTMIEFAIINPQNVSLDVYDLQGRHIENIYRGFRNTGIYSVRFDASNLSSGVYLYKLTTQRGTETRKLTLIK